MDEPADAVILSRRQDVPKEISTPRQGIRKKEAECVPGFPPIRQSVHLGFPTQRGIARDGCLAHKWLSLNVLRKDG